MTRVRVKRQVWAIIVSSLMLGGLSPRIAAQQNAETEEWTIPEGTEFKLQLHSTINSRTSKAGDRVLSTLIDPVAVEDREVLPKGVRIVGHVGEVKAAARKGKGGYHYITFDTVELPNGEKVAILGSLTEIFSSEGGTDSTVGVEGELKGRGASRTKQVAIVGAGTAAGVAGGVGPTIAAGVGSMIAAILLPRGKQATLTAGSLVGMRLDRDVSVTLAASNE